MKSIILLFSNYTSSSELMVPTIIFWRYEVLWVSVNEINNVPLSILLTVPFSSITTLTLWSLLSKSVMKKFLIYSINWCPLKFIHCLMVPLQIPCYKSISIRFTIVHWKLLYCHIVNNTFAIRLLTERLLLAWSRHNF